MRAENLVERMIAKRLIQELLAADFLLSVNDGEETVLKRSADKLAIFEAMFSTDEDYLIVSKDGKKIGWIKMIYGNDGFDVISDYTMNLESVLGPVNVYISDLEKGVF